MQTAKTFPVILQTRESNGCNRA